MMKNKLRILGVLLFLISCLVVPAHAEPISGYDYYIQDYHVDATYHDNNTVDLTETIEVYFDQPHHGIYRSIDTTAFVNRGEVMEYQFLVKNAEVKNAPFEVSGDNGFTLQIGDPDRYVQGKQTYEISYTLVIPDDRIEDSDFLFYSVLGSGWEVPIRQFSFQINFEKPLSEEAVKEFKLYSGAYGSETNDLDVTYSIVEDHVSGEAHNIPPHNSITVFANEKEGYFVNEYEPSETPGIVLGLLSALAGLGTMITLIFRPRKKPVITVEFYPPEGISSAEAGTIVDEKADDKDLQSLIPWFADQGYLTMEQVPDKKGRYGKHASLILHKVKDLPATAPIYQKTFFNGLFETGDSVNMQKLPKKFGDAFDVARDQLSGLFTGSRKLSEGSLPAIGLMAVVILVVAAALAASSPISAGGNLLPAFFFGVPALAAAVYRISSSVQDHIRSKGSWVGQAIVLAILGAISMAGAFFCLKGECILPKVFFAVPVIIWAGICFSGRMVKETDYKIENTGKLLGLKQFIETAELDKLKMLAEENPEYFYNVLPYAMAFGLSDIWAKQFKDIPTVAPSWYYGNDPDVVFSSMYWYTVMDRGLVTPVSNHVTESRAFEANTASGSSIGGGFAGGGFGGGGGGAW